MQLELRDTLMRAAAALLLVAAGAFTGHGRLAYVSRGSLYVLDGSRVVRVMGGGASAPAFSPDGRWLSYAYRGRVGVARADGTHAHALRAPSASWLPDGELFASGSLYRIARSGIPVRVGVAPGLVAWAADGTRYAFVVSHGGRNGVELLQAANTPTGRRTTWLRVPQRFTPSSGFRSPAIGSVVVLPGERGVLVSLVPLHSASLAADGVPVYELTAPRTRLRKLGTTVGGSVSVGGGRFAIGAGVDRYAWRTKQALSCTVARCTPLATPKGTLTLEPALSPDGTTLGYVTAGQEPASSFLQPTLRRWYATRRLWVGNREIPGSAGAAAPIWSRDGKSLLFVKDDALWLLPRLDAKPVRVAGPLFPPDAWPSYYGQVDWTAQFAWSP